MSLLDWAVILASLSLVVGLGAYTQTYMKSVADFLAARRVARRYLLAVGRGEMEAGAVVYVGAFEVLNHSGFSYVWWTTIPQPLLLVVTIFGFVIYRYRETRALTLGQFFEIRYSKSLRLFAGFLGFFAGLLNFGIMPSIGARAMVYFLELPTTFHLLVWTVPTYIVLMGLFLSLNLFVVLSGGILTIMMTNVIEGVVSQVLYLVLIFALMSLFPWSGIHATLADQPAGHSYLNPMDSFATQNFNIWLILMGIAGSVYGTMAWQNQSSYNSAPLTAHEGVMGGLLGRWRGLGQGAIITLLAICAMTYLHEPAYAAGASEVRAQLAQIGNSQTREQMEIPVAITHLLPYGCKGTLCAVLLLGLLGGDSNHLHSWGSLFIQDVIVPLRRRPFSPKNHIRVLRWSIFGVAVFVFFFGIYFPLSGYIKMWWTITMSIYIGGAGAVIIGGLYWKKGTTAGAWVAFLSGSILSLAGIAAETIYGAAFPLNGAEVAFYTMLVAITIYVAVSLATCRENFNMDRMLHRGAYAQVTDASGDGPDRAASKPSRWGKIIGFNENFTRGDKWIAGGLFAWMMFNFLITVVGTIWNVIHPWPLAVWSEFWRINAVYVPIALAVITGIWFTWGGVVDSVDLFRRLRLQKVSASDDGRVVDHQNEDEHDPESRAPSATKSRNIESSMHR